MVYIDFQNAQPQTQTIVLAQAAKPNATKLYGTMGVCYLSPTAEQINAERDTQGYYSISVIGNADEIFFNGPHMPRLELNLEKAVVTVLLPPKHGTLKPTMRDSLGNDLSAGQDTSYYPNAGYVGNDKAEFLVNIEGYKIKVVYFIKVNPLYDTTTHPVDLSKCPNPNPWKISTDSTPALGTIESVYSQGLTLRSSGTPQKRVAP